MTSIDEKIAALHVSMVRAEDAGHSGEAQWYVWEIRRLEDLRESPQWRAHRRFLELALARCLQSANPDGAAVVRAQIERWERGVLT